MVPDKDGKFTLCSDTTSSADALKLKADNAAAGEAWIEALRDATRVATRKLEEDRAAALEAERRKVEAERRARLEAESAAKKAAEEREEVTTRRSLDSDGAPSSAASNPDSNKRFEHAQKMVSKLTQEVCGCAHFTHPHKHAQTRTYTYAQACLHAFAFARSCMHVCIHVCTACMRVCMYVCVYACRYVCMYACMYV